MLKRKMFNIFAALLIALGSMPMSFLNVYAADEPGGITPAQENIPKSLKSVKSNGDGTYDITLEIEGVSSQKTDATKANVVVVFDSSGSMDTRATTYEYSVSTSGRYRKVNGDYIQLWRINGLGYCVRMDNDNSTTRVFTEAGCDEANLFTGTRYTRTRVNGTRLSVAKTAVNVLANELLSQNDPNTAGFEDVVEMALVDFGRTVKTDTTHTTPTTSLDTFKGWVRDIEQGGGTNWEDALTTAKNVSFGTNDNDKVYVIFVSDGNPTYRNSKYDDNANDCKQSSGGTCVLWGNGNDDPYPYRNYNAAKAVANTIVSNTNMELYAVGAFGDATNMQNIGGTYYDATDQDALEEAFADIIDKIKMGLSVASLQIEDGITPATSTEIDGAAGNFRYNVPESWGSDYEKATFENGSVHWNPGEFKTLSSGEKASVTFTVWPSQEAMDCIASIRNDGTCEESDLTRFGLGLNDDGSYRLITNSTATFRFKTATKVEGSDEMTYSEISVPINFEEDRDPTNLPETELEVTKLWADGMDPGQRDDIAEITLKLKVDDEEVRTFVFNKQGSEGNEWKNSYTYAVAPGVMKKLDGTPETEGLREVAKKIVTVGNAEYAVLEEGHDYLFDESYTLDANGTNHYHITKKLYHPMIVDDGKIHEVVFSEDGNSAVIEEIELTKLSAENTLNGGILVGKKVINNGKEDTDITDEYKITINMTGSDSGKYRVYTYNKDGSVASRSDKKDYTGGKIEETIKVNQKIMVTDVPTGTTFVVTEQLPEGYTRNEVNYEVIKYVGSNTQTVPNVNEVFGNASSTATVTNYLTSGNLIISKEVTATSGNLTQARNQEFDFTVKFYKKSGDETAVRTETFKLKHGETKEFKNIPSGWYYEIVEAAKPGFNNGVATTKTGTIETGNNEKKFTNNYAVSKLTGDDAKVIGVKAFVSGYEKFWLNSDQFELQLIGNGEVLDSISVNKLGPTAEFMVDIKDEGTYTYTITEKTKNTEGSSAFRPGILRLAGDQDIVVTIEVKDKGDGTLEVVSKEYSKESRKIFNLYEATSTYGKNGELKFKKVLEGRDWEDSDEFTFTIESKNENASMPKNTSLVAKKGKTEIDFGEIKFTQADVGNTYNYVVKETFDVPSVTPADEVAGGISFTIKVTDNEDGTLNLEVSEYKNTFTNIYKTTSVNASKVWDDDNNRDDLRKNYTNLYVAVRDEDGKFVAYEALANVDKDYTFSGLQESNADGEAIKYTVVEAKNCATASDGSITCTVFNGDNDYTATVSDNKITNSHTPATTSVLVKKTWVGENAVPNSIIVNITGGGVSRNETISESDKVEGECTEWCKRIDGLKKYDQGVEIEYVVRETAITGATAEGFIEYGTDVTSEGQKSVKGKWNAHEAKNTSTWTVTNTWVPATSLYNGSTDFAIKKIDKNGNALSGVKFTVNGDEYTTGSDGKIKVEIPANPLVRSETKNYEIIETVAKDGYDLDGDAANLQVVIESGLVSVNETTLVNTYAKSFTFTASGNKHYVWNKEERMFILENKRSEAKSLTIEKTYTGVSEKVIKNSDISFTVSGPEDFEDKIVTISEFKFSDGKATFELKNLPTGKYTVTENGGELEGLFVHETTGDVNAEIELKKGATATAKIENTYTVLKTASYKVTKEWNDDDNRDGLRPGTLTVNLKAGGETVGTVDLTATNGWTYTFTELPVANEDAETIEYSAEEVTPKGYTLESTTVGEGETTFKNKHELELYDKTGELTVIKVWDDEENLLNSRPINITVELWGNGSKITSATLSEDAEGIWTHTFEGLYANEDGKPIEYEVREASVFGYSAEYSKDEDGNFVVTNTIPDVCVFGGCGHAEEPPITPDTGMLTRGGNDGGASQNSVVAVVMGGLMVVLLLGAFRKRKAEADK